MATTTLTGTTGNNLLNAPGSVSTLVQGLQGNDTITLALVNDEAQAGQGNDSIAFTSSGAAANTISAGDGQDTVWLRGGGQWAGIANLNAGNDSIAIGSANQLGIVNGGQIYGGAGNDTIRLLNVATNATFGGGQNSDVLSFSAGAFTNVVVNGGQQADSIFLANAASTFVTVQGGKGFDTISASSGVLGDYTQSSLVAGGQGNDSITLGGALITSVAGGKGNDTIRGLGSFGSGVIFADSLGTTTGEDGDGADLISFTAAALAGPASIYAGGGADTISLSAGNVATGSNLISGGNGADSIQVGQTTVAFGSIFGGAGNDTIRVLGTASTQISAGQTQISTIYGGAGTDLIIFSASASSLTQQAITGGGTAYNAILSDVSGDTLRLLTGTNFGTANGVSANWSFAGAPVVFVASSTLFTGKETAFSAGGSAQGSIGVFSDGTDSIIGIYSGGTAASAFNFFRINGIDLTITTVVGQNVAFSASNFRFTVAANSGGGMNITFS